jgi:predicted flap endonuclease-1-like 5' DNA nuclease
MGVFDTIRSILGIDGSSDGETTELPVGSEPSDGPDIDESAAAGTDATASTDSMTETPSSDPETAAEPAEAGAGVTEHSGTETTAAESAEAAGPVPDEAEPGASEAAEDESHDLEETDADTDADESEGADGESVDTISGIGPAYAERLADAGVETVEQLRAADASELAEETELSEKRIAGWQE